MTDYRDPNPNRPGYRDPSLPPESSHWSTATWGWIAGLSVVVLILIFAFGMSGNGDRTAMDNSKSPPATSGQRTLPPPAPPAVEAPSVNPAPPPMPPKQ